MANAVRMQSPWVSLSRQNAERLGGQTGVFEIRNEDGRILYIGYAGGNSLFGLRGEVIAQLEDRGSVSGLEFRCEVTSSYLSRFQELLMLYVYDHARLDVGHSQFSGRLGVLSPLAGSGDNPQRLAEL